VQKKFEFGNIALFTSLAFMFVAIVPNWMFYLIDGGLGCITLIVHPTLEYNLWAPSASSVFTFFGFGTLQQKAKSLYGIN